MGALRHSGSMIPLGAGQAPPGVAQPRHPMLRAVEARGLGVEDPAGPEPRLQGMMSGVASERHRKRLPL